jgi:hypothetical protein
MRPKLAGEQASRDVESIHIHLLGFGVRTRKSPPSSCAADSDNARSSLKDNTWKNQLWASLGPDGPAARAIAFVDARSEGPPLPPGTTITVQFHPDRLHLGEPLLRTLARDGVYRSQFETGSGNGALTAFRGGTRRMWESRMFGGAYDEAEPTLRPKYGALDVHKRSTGASPRFGSSFFRLRPELTERATFCYPDSVFSPTAFGTAHAMSLFELFASGTPDPLDHYIEAQVHGDIVLARDVEQLVLDPCFQNTEVEELARTLPCRVSWHEGFRLNVADIDNHADYRGATFVALAVALATRGELTAREIGHAARANSHDEQALKRVWHYVARFGTAALAGSR